MTERRVWIKTSLIAEPSTQKRSFRRRTLQSSNTAVQEATTASALCRSASHDGLEDMTQRRAAQRPGVRRTQSGDDMPIITVKETPNEAVSSSRVYEWSEGWMTWGDDALRIRVKGRNEPVTLSPSQMDIDVLLANPEPSNYPHDLVTLDDFHEPTVVEALQSRYAKGLLYTSTGAVLIATNPFRHLPHVYGDEVMEQYWTKFEKATEDLLPPHVYAIADHSFRSMMRGIEMALGRKLNTKFDQSILVSGESGAGKTVTTKYLMKYLAALSQRSARHAATRSTQRAYLQVKRPPASTEAASPDRGVTGRSSDLSQAANLWSDGQGAALTASSIESQVLQSNPILESFGNARTIRNDNSSRFGKFIEMQFTSTGRLVGTRIETYLLEKVRVVVQSAGERNYHIFYELLSGQAEPEELSSFRLDARTLPHDFKILASGTYGRRDGVSDRDTFRDLCKAMRMMGFTDQERLNVFQVAAAVLHASNIVFNERNHGDASALQRNNKHLGPACDLLGVTVDDLNDALCFYTITAEGRSFRSTKTVEKAEKGLHALMKATYAALFTYLVRRVNDTIAFREPPETLANKKGSAVAFIGVLDIFGFESFSTNSFEQLCINYCNEALQQQFNTFMLKNEQAEYASEGIDWNFIKFPENQDVLDLIDDRQYGIMTLLDDMCRAPGATDQAFGIDLLKRCHSRPRFEAGDSRSMTLHFTVHHFAGPVEYSTAGFVAKNRDDLPRETYELLMTSKNPFVHMLAGIIGTVETDTTASGKKGKRDAARPTVGGHFRQQVKDLRAKIDTTKPHYVRCIKPNELLKPGHFDPALVAHQLRCGGILQAVSVTRAGFTLHYTHADFVQRYRVLVSEESLQISPTIVHAKARTHEQCQRLVEILLQRMEKHGKENVPDESKRTNGHKKPDTIDLAIQFGKSKVLLKHHAFETLERWLGALQNAKATELNASFRRYLCRVAFLSVRESFRQELRLLGQSFAEWFQENRELYYQPRDKTARAIPNIVSQRLALYQKNARGSFRKEVAPSRRKMIPLANAAWMLEEGLWTRNPNYRAENSM